MNLGSKELTRARLGSKELTRIHLGSKEILTAKVQLRYELHFYAVTGVAFRVDIKKYSLKDNSLVEEKTITDNGDTTTTYEHSYNDGIISVDYGSLTQTRWTFTPLVEGETTVEGCGANVGSDYGGTAEQLVPYVGSYPYYCDITFVTTDKYKP